MRAAAEEEPPPAPVLLLVALPIVVVPVHRVPEERRAGGDEGGLDVGFRIHRYASPAAADDAVLGVPRSHRLGHFASLPALPPLATRKSQLTQTEEGMKWWCWVGLVTIQKSNSRDREIVFVMTLAVGPQIPQILVLYKNISRGPHGCDSG